MNHIWLDLSENIQLCGMKKNSDMGRETEKEMGKKERRKWEKQTKWLKISDMEWKVDRVDGHNTIGVSNVFLPSSLSLLNPFLNLLYSRVSRN